MLTCKEMQAKGLLVAIADNFQDSVSVGFLLAKADIKTAKLQPFEKLTIQDWWQLACLEIERQLGSPALTKLLQAAADTYPGEKRFAEFLQESSKPQNRENKGGNICISLSKTLSVDDVLKIMQFARETVLDTGGDFMLNMGKEGSSLFSLSILGERTEEEIEEIRSAIAHTLTAANFEAEVELEPYHFRDYYSDPITLEGPDGQQFAIDQVRASTTVSDLARGLMGQYADQGIWPTRKDQKTQAVIDKVGADGSPSQRLDPRLTLHDAGVRPGDTLRISPERTAGAIDPMLREAALARVRNEVLAYAGSHPGFAVEANSLVAPTEYLFRFSVPGFGPPGVEGGPPRRIDNHEVLVELPPDFPIKAPEAWWQTDIYHANIDFKSGMVCLGALQEHYRPAMDFGELCQMLVDLAGYRNYTVTEGYNAEAAQWAITLAGQRAIESIGGISLLGRMVMDGAAEKTFKIRKIQP